VDVCPFARSGERDVGAFLSGVLSDDQMSGVGCMSLGGERMLNVGEPDVGSVELVAVERGLTIVVEAQPQ
jgi:hypothetical protein